MSKYRLTRLAERDVIDIYLYSTEHFGEAQAERYNNGLSARFFDLANRPPLGRDYSHVKSGVRRAEYVSHSIYYRPAEEGVVILRILHQRMDPARWL